MECSYEAIGLDVLCKPRIVNYNALRMGTNFICAYIVAASENTTFSYVTHKMQKPLSSFSTNPEASQFYPFKCTISIPKIPVVLIYEKVIPFGCIVKTKKEPLLALCILADQSMSVQ
jgi:hypothetical protein